MSQLQQRAERSCQCRIIKTSVEVTGSLEGMQHSKAPLLSCFLCELSRPLHIYSSRAQRALSSPLPSNSQTDVTFKPPCISGTKHNAFSSLTSGARRQSTEQQESKDNISVPSFVLPLPGGQGAGHLSLLTVHRYMTAFAKASQFVFVCWAPRTVTQEASFNSEPRPQRTVWSRPKEEPSVKGVRQP